MTVALVDGTASDTNEEIVAAWRAAGIEAAALSVSEALDRLCAGDLVIGRVDVRPTLDGPEPGLHGLGELERRGAVVLNRPAALLAAHDKLRTSRLLVRAGVPHPTTVHVRPGGTTLVPAGCLVVKPRFGSWARDVFRCESATAYAETLDAIADRPWFRRHGAIVQAYVPSGGRDLRVLVARGRVVGAAQRIARPGEWRTNVSLGASLRPAVPSPAACGLAVAAAAALRIDLVGVDLLPLEGRYVVLELNGAVDFSRVYSLPGRDVYADIARAVGITPQSTATERSTRCAAGLPIPAPRS